MGVKTKKLVLLLGMLIVLSSFVLAQDSYIVVNAVNPEMIEIGSIEWRVIGEGFFDFWIEIYDGADFLGYGAYDKQTANTPIAVSSGAHTIRVDFNGMSIEKIVNLDPGKTERLVFIFDRTEFNISQVLNDSINAQCSVSIAGTFNLDEDQGYGDIDECEDTFLATVGISAETESDESLTGSYSADMSFDFEGTSFYLESSVSLSTTGDGWANLWSFFKPADGYTYKVPMVGSNMPTNNDFDYWISQYIREGDYLSVNACPYEGFGITCGTIILRGWEGDDMEGYDVLVFPASDTYTVWISEFAQFMPVLSIHPLDPPKSEIWQGQVTDLKLSSVPYDILGTGVLIEEKPFACFRYSVSESVIGVTVDASCSYDLSGGEIVEYRWDFEGWQGWQPTGKVVNVPYSMAGVYTGTLTVVNDKGQTDSTAKDMPLLIMGDKVGILNMDNPKETSKKLCFAYTVEWAGLSTLIAGVSLLSNFVFISGIAKVIILGASLSPVTIIASLASTGLIAIYNWQNDVWIKETEALCRLANDPPDDNYTEVMEIELYEIYPTGEGNTSMDVSIINFTNHMSENQAILQALTTSIERFEGALIANEIEYILLQAKALKNYSDMMIESLIKLNNSAEDLIGEIEIIESNPTISVQLEEMQERVEMEGFTQEEIDYFESLGANDTEIDNYEEKLIEFSITEFKNKIEEFRAGYEESILIYINLSDQASDIIELLEEGEKLPGDVNLTLTKGWNLMSIPLNLPNNSINYLFNEANISIYGYKNNSWLVPNEIDNTLAYWIKVNQSLNLTINGSRIINKTINMQEGWNLIDYIFPTDNITTALSSINGCYQYVFSWYDLWTSFNPLRLFSQNSLKNMTFSRGYWIKVNCTYVNWTVS